MSDEADRGEKDDWMRGVIGERDALRERLAQKDATIARLREALRVLIGSDWFKWMVTGKWSRPEARDAVIADARAALAATADSAAWLEAEKEKVRIEEREACAKVADDWPWSDARPYIKGSEEFVRGVAEGIRHVAIAIRARQRGEQGGA